ncbi:erythromycin esterase family protein [Azohydromonas aeria]|uniref:erythromycin esterase family protein n=1 Tax=Azohydromonas aeria TaxID=2590212 RepID=UPI0012F96F13|nr:erythromycin esterase family protein [Azohydromonas aeria]
MTKFREAALQAIRQSARPLTGPHALDGLLDLAGDARVVVLGAAAPGSREGQQLRAEITRRLVTERGFDAVAVDADAGAALRVHRWLHGRSPDASAAQALGGFGRFPGWTWRNAETMALLQALRAWNEAQGAGAARPAGFFGLDFHDAGEARHALLRHLDEADPAAARRARERFACQDDFTHHVAAPGHAVAFGLEAGAEGELLALLANRARHAGQRLARQGSAGADVPDERFFAARQALALRDGEAHWRGLLAGRADSWNVRTRHLAGTLQALREHLAVQHGRAARIVVWTHNAQAGDARATDRAAHGQLSLGQLLRDGQADADSTFLLGITAHEGLLAAAPDWDAPALPMVLQPSRIDSVERLLHESGLGHFVLPLTRGAPAALRQALQPPRLERGIGAVYRPGTERWSHYFHACLPAQFDAVAHLDRCEALQALTGVPT